MQPLKKRSLDLLGQISVTYDQLAIDAKQEELTAIEEQLSDANVWANPERAQILARESATLRGQVEPWQVLKSQISDIVELIDLGDETMLPEFEQQINALEDEYRERRKELLFDGEYDGRGAILKLSSGVGGTDAQDWTEMLERMYLRWAEKSGLTTELVERSTGEMAGIKSATYIVRGAYAYGKLRSEHGVHRLVRLSPFNSDNLRQTSFALVEVMPEIDAPDEVSIADKDLKIDVYRSGGHGGQSVNTTDSAVRVTHIPTGTVVAIQNERSQIQNRETALKILRGKLTQMKLEQHAETLADLRAGESASWGAQIRNYVLHPYTMVKDTRTKHENRDVQGVLDGSIDEFIDAYLSQGIS
ncbi:peptide chain release factor 2 [Candidatus Saccharibacteria bacterium oral taxon 955]|nr:peptide chain release factor 2 [Candidatus Saccharibacteria bacterium oral taxon 955]QJU05670.1 peptide chain release factor 2 [Candidatus Saccharibacteria bacterium oral taxon 955]